MDFQSSRTIALKIDVDTEAGTRNGIPTLMRIFDSLHISATFLFSLGPDNTGRAIKRIFRPGFFQKVSRTNVLGTYGLRTLCNGILWPGPHIGRRHKDLMRSVSTAGHKVGIHCYDHIAWQDQLHSMTYDQVKGQIQKAVDVFCDIFEHSPTTMGAAGWQTSRHSLSTYDTLGLQYVSDVRGSFPFYPMLNGEKFQTLQIPTTMPTLDEVLGVIPTSDLYSFFDTHLEQSCRVYTLHAELEGGPYAEWFEGLLKRWIDQGFTIGPVESLSFQDPVSCEIDLFGSIAGRSGTLAVQKTT